MAAATKSRSIFYSKVNDVIKIGLCQLAVESTLLNGLNCFSSTSTIHANLDAAYRCILRNALGVHFNDRISDEELTRRTEETVLSKYLCHRSLSHVGHTLGMAISSTLMKSLHFLQPGHRRRVGQALTLTLHQNVIDVTAAINLCYLQLLLQSLT